MDKHRAYTCITILPHWINICVSWLLTGGPIGPEITIIIIPVKMHSYWYWLTHRNIATPLILYQKLDLNNRPVYTEHDACSITWSSYYIPLCWTWVHFGLPPKWHHIQSMGLFLVYHSRERRLSSSNWMHWCFAMHSLSLWLLMTISSPIPPPLHRSSTLAMVEQMFGAVRASICTVFRPSQTC